MQTIPVRGSIPEIVRNDAQLYEGELVAYFRVIFRHANNLQLPYHNFRHIFHVVWLCHGACEFYREQLTKREMRNLLIAALFHDFDHGGRFGDDDLNIEKAIRGLRRHVLEEDRLYLPDIEVLIRATQFPYDIKTEELPLLGKIIRDADLSQALSVAWVQQVIFGLAAEWGKSPLYILRIQGPFLEGLTFQTEWAQKQFPKADISGKMKEAREYLALLGEETEPARAA